MDASRPPCAPDWDRAPAFGRRETLLAALQRLYQLHPGPACLVETGTLRDDSPHGCDGDGWSTLAWGWYAQQTGGRAVTVDIDPACLAVCRGRTADYAAHLEYVAADSVAYLGAWTAAGRGPIHLLYLDSLDYFDAAVSEAHGLAEATAALPALAAVCLVLFDDTHPHGEPAAPGAAPALWGKGARAVPFLLAAGFRLEWVRGGQVLLSRGAEGDATGLPGEGVARERAPGTPGPDGEEREMGQETRKAHARRRREGYFETVFVGAGLDIGSGDDPVLPDCVHWDLPQGDAAALAGVPLERFDWIYSSHCLEHLADPYHALARWWEVLKPGGRLLLVVPDEDLYEQGQWPSVFNPGHRWTFTIHKSRSWSPVSVNLTDLVAALPGHRVMWFRTCDAGYEYGGGVWDRTGGPAEAHIEVLVRKEPREEDGPGPEATADARPDPGREAPSAPAGASERPPGGEPAAPEGDVRAVLHALPHRVGMGSDWVEAPNGYPWHARIVGALRPARYVEFGAHLGYSLLAALEGAPALAVVAWADNESYIPGSNRLCAENLAYYLRGRGRAVDTTVCAGVEALAAREPADPARRAFEEADVLFVDGDHRFESTLRDLRLARALGARCVLVDDCLSECDPDVPRAVEAFARETGYPYVLVPTYRGMAVFDFTDPPGLAWPTAGRRLAQAGLPVRAAAPPDGRGLEPEVRPVIGREEGRTPAFEAVWRAAEAYTVVGRDRCEFLYAMAQWAALWGGKLWECGVYRGGSALFLAEAAPGATVRLFDTFCGLPPVHPVYDLHREGDFGDTSVEAVAACFARYPHVRLHPGRFPETFAGLEAGRIGLLHLDAVLYASVREGLAGCYPRMDPSGIVVIDDYGFPSCPGARRAVEEFFADKPEQPRPLATGPALVLMAGMPAARRQAVLRCVPK